MPVTKSAKKKLRQDKKRRERNKKLIIFFEKLLKKAKKQPSEKTITAAFSAIDKATKRNIIHKNKAARIKSSLSKLLPKKTKKEISTKVLKKPRKKAKKN